MDKIRDKICKGTHDSLQTLLRNNAIEYYIEFDAVTDAMSLLLSSVYNIIIYIRLQSVDGESTTS